MELSYANSHVNVGGTTTLDVGGDMTVKGGVFTTDKLTGQVAGNLNMESLQDTYVYDSKQKQAGFSADIDLATGAGSSLSVKGGRTDINADYAAVTEQTGIYAQQSDLNVGGKGVIKGAAYTTASAEDNQTVFAQGIETSDIQNHSNYDAKAIAAGLTIGKAKDTNPEASLNGIGYGTDSDNQTRTTKAGVAGMAGQSDVTTATKDSLNEVLVNSFDASTVNEELGAQVEITRAFDQERRKIKTELNKDEQKLRDEAKEQEALGNYTARNELLQQADKVQQKALLFDGITSALYGPNANGATGYLAKSISPQIANQIGKYYKDNDVTNKENQNKDLAGVNSPQHLLAHALLGAAVSAATGNDALTGGISASSGEVTATLLSKYIYKVDNLSELTAEQKDTISNITTLAGVAIGSTTGEVTDAVNAGETAKVAVEDNAFDPVHKSLKDPRNWLDSKNYSYAVFEKEATQCQVDNNCSSVLFKYWSQHENNFQKLKAGCSTGNETVCTLWANDVASQLIQAKNISDPELREFYTLSLLIDLNYLDSKITINSKVKSELLFAGLGGGLTIGSFSKGSVRSHLASAGIGTLTGASIDALTQKIMNGTVNYQDVIASGIVGGIITAPVGKYSTTSTQAAQNAAPGSISFMNKNDQFVINAAKRQDVNPNGMLDVVAHGAPNKIEVSIGSKNPVLVDHRTAARLIQQSPDYIKGQPIRLLSCSTGKCDTGFAQNLANKLGVPVQAPSDLIWAFPSGKMIIAPRRSTNPSSPLYNQPDLRKVGEFKTFNPNGK